MKNNRRIMLSLPCGTPEEKGCCHAVLDFFEDQKGNKVLPVSGFTYSDFDKPVYTGRWRDDENDEVIEEPVSLCLVDVFFDGEEEKIERQLEGWYREISGIYRGGGSKQIEMYLIETSIKRHLPDG